MEDNKHWFASKTIWGGFAAAAAGLLGLFGYNILPEDQAALVEYICGTITVIGSLVAVIGRWTASKTISTGSK